MIKSKEKIDRILWMIIWLVPFISFFIGFRQTGTETPIFTYIDTNFSFAFVKNLIDQIWATVFSGSSLCLSGYISYLVAVEVIHCLFDAVVFIPRFAHDLIESFTGRIKG